MPKTDKTPRHDRTAHLETTESLAFFANALRDCLDLEPLPSHDGSRKKVGR